MCLEGRKDAGKGASAWPSKGNNVHGGEQDARAASMCPEDFRWAGQEPGSDKFWQPGFLEGAQERTWLVNLFSATLNEEII